MGKKKKSSSLMWTAIWFSVIYLVIYAAGVLFQSNIMLVEIMFLASPAVVIWVTISILKDPVQPDKTFDKHFYQDEDIKRNYV